MVHANKAVEVEKMQYRSMLGRVDESRKQQRADVCNERQTMW
jgi:hypothetical protein